MYNFAFASPKETLICGAERPGYPDTKRIEADTVDEWIEYMQMNGVVGVVCLLEADQLAFYQQDLLATYRDAFGDDMVCWAPVKDYGLADVNVLNKVILPFLDEAADLGLRVVVHCSAGMGRTGQVLAAWLVHRYDASAEEALNTVERMQRNPRELVWHGQASEEALIALLESTRKT